LKRACTIDEKIQVRVTSSGRTLEVVVLHKRLEMIQIVLARGATASAAT
jgi:hypothetical protein